MTQTHLVDEYVNWEGLTMIWEPVAGTHASPLRDWALTLPRPVFPPSHAATSCLNSYESILLAAIQPWIIAKLDLTFDHVTENYQRLKHAEIYEQPGIWLEFFTGKVAMADLPHYTDVGGELTAGTLVFFGVDHVTMATGNSHPDSMGYEWPEVISFHAEYAGEHTKVRRMSMYDVGAMVWNAGSMRPENLKHVEIHTSKFRWGSN